ncbi:MAG: undecaprenyl-diphosphate phosphatase [Bacteroidales bacterium]|nr:undecaprenyl-diphosphate phosphatase [Bacteroidales bacterium]
MDWLQALILGLIQGLTEFLPVSSSGHFIIGKEILGVEVADNVTFVVLVHAATVLSTITVFRKEIWQLLTRFFKFQWNEETQYIVKICISMIPVLIVGLFFKDTVEGFFGEGLLLVGIMLIVTAILLFLSQYIKFEQRKEVGFGSAFAIGCAQAVAVLPGLSRSGTTIATGLLLGVKKESVAQFSFLMVLVPILGEAFLDLVGGDFAAAASGIPASAMITGFLAAYFSGLFACRVMIELVKRAKLTWFAVYCTVVGAIAIVYSVI